MVYSFETVELTVPVELVSDVLDESMVVAFVTEVFTDAPMPINSALTSAPTSTVVVLDQPLVTDAPEETLCSAVNESVCVRSLSPPVLSMIETSCAPFASVAVSV